MQPTELDNYSVKRFGMTLTDSILAVLALIACVIGIVILLANAQNMFGGGRLHDRAVKLAHEVADQIKNETNLKQNYESSLGANCNNKSQKIKTASNTIACWQDKVQQQLSNGTSRIYLDGSVKPAQYVIMVSWSEPSSGTASYILRITPPNPTAKTDVTRVAN